MLDLIFSNRYEILETALLDELAGVPPDPFEPQHVIVPSLAVRRRLDVACADRFGVSANLRCQYLAPWLWEQIARFVTVPRASPFAPDLLQWRLFRLFSEHSGAGSARLAGYLERSDDGMRLELAQRVAALFDQYLTYRPEWLEAWSEGKPADLHCSSAEAEEDARWQATLWQAMTAELGMNPFHPAGGFFRQASTVAADDPRLKTLPRQAAVFCLPTVPRLYLHLLEWLARWMPIRLYLLNPCHEYWMEAVDAKRLARLSLNDRDLFHEVGNPLLASWGQQTQAQIQLLLGEMGAETQIDGLFQSNPAQTLLAAVQNAILEMQPLQLTGGWRADRSIEFHSCHSLQRQLEVLHDQLLDLFNQPDAPAPAEVLIVTPQLATAAPLIDAVFGAQPAERRIPFAITGRPASQENGIARVLFALFEQARGRFAASAVFELLLEPAVARRFGFSPAEVDDVQNWIRGAGIRWGFDGEHREKCGLPGSPRHTFAEGLQRLFLGYAMPDGEDRIVAGMLPFAAAEGVEARVLGQFWQFIETLKQAVDRLAEARPALAWRTLLDEMLADFVQPDEEGQGQLRDVRDTITAVTGRIAEGAGDIPVSLPVLNRALSDALDDPTRGGVPSGRVTFAAMPSLRALPYRMVCFLGMDDGVFPSPVVHNEFDLMAQTTPRPGDRQRQRDERNLFLDLLLSARERVIFTYTGRSIRDNSHLPPSVLLAELLDHLAEAIAAGSGDAFEQARHALIVEHPLQAFSPRYFRDGEADERLFSFDADYCAAARDRLAAAEMTLAATAASPSETEEEGEDGTRSPFLPSRLPAPVAEEAGHISLDQLFHFFRNPCQYLLRDRLGIRLQQACEALGDEEPFGLDREGRQSFSNRLLPLLLQGLPLAEAEKLAAAGGEFPEGIPGDLQRRQELADLAGFAGRVAVALETASPEPLPFRQEFVLESERWILSGPLSHVHADGQVRYRYDAVRESDYLSAWIAHLALCACVPPGTAPVTRAIALDGGFQLQPVAEPMPLLLDLLQLYREGLTRPLHFFPRSAWAYMQKRELGNAHACWLGGAFRNGEQMNPWYRLALRGEADPLGGEFAGLAERVLAPLLEHLTKPEAS